MTQILKIGSKFMNSTISKFVTQKGKPNKYFVVLKNNDVYSISEIEALLNNLQKLEPE